MKTRSKSTVTSKNRVDYKKLADDGEEEAVNAQAPVAKQQKPNPPSPPAEQATTDAPPSKPENKEGDTVVNVVTDTSKIIDDFLKALRPDEDQPRPSSSQPQAVRPPLQMSTSNGPEQTAQSPTVANHAYDTLPPPRQRSGPEAAVAKDTKFPCTFARYGCVSTFASKNEWKRHVAIQHVQLGFYRCDVGVCNPENRDPHSRDSGYNDFNRKDLFTMHQRRMHSPWGVVRQPTTEEKETFEQSLEGVRQRCWRAKRQPPLRTVCGFCGRLFEDKVPSLSQHTPGQEMSPSLSMPAPPPMLSPLPAATTLQGLAQAATDAAAPERSVDSTQGPQSYSIVTEYKMTHEPHAQETSGAMDVDQNTSEALVNDPSPTSAQSHSNYPPPTPLQQVTPASMHTPMSAQPATPGQAPTTAQLPIAGWAQVPYQPQSAGHSYTPTQSQMMQMPPHQIPVDAHGQPIVRDPTAWEDRMEHVGRHLAKEDAHLREEAEDKDLTAWGLREGLLKDCGPKGVWLIGLEPQGDSLDGIIRKRKKRIK